MGRVKPAAAVTHGLDRELVDDLEGFVRNGISAYLAGLPEACGKLLDRKSTRLNSSH